jgi:hypothetical protein
MKKSILASSIAAAVFGLGAAGVQAQAATGGDIVLVPYFTAQGNNATLLSITNTDTLNGKAVKVRFRGAANSDDIYDFQVFLSPTDVWTANISKGADGRAVLKTSDASCTKPSAAVLNATPFVTGRLNPALTGDALANGTREGYIEILSMADIPKDRLTGSGVGTSAVGAADALPVLSVAAGGDGTTNRLYTAIKHVKSVAPCSGTAFTALDTVAWPMTTMGTADSASAKGMTPSTGGLIANWTVINTVNAAAWSGAGTELPVTGAKNVLYAPQTAAAVSMATADIWTADPLLITNRSAIISGTYSNEHVATPIIAAGAYDFPDLSTPWATGQSPANVALQLQNVLMKSSVSAEYLTDAAINGSTDWVFSMPTRRYSVAMAYNKIKAGDDGRRFNTALQLEGTHAFDRTKTSVVGGLICVTGAKPVPYDREENTVVSSTEVVVSPSSPTGGQLYCGEASVFSFNNGVGTTAALNASVAVTAVDAPFATGWASLAVGYPVLGGSFMKASNGAQGYGIYQAYRAAR